MEDIMNFDPRSMSCFQKKEEVFTFGKYKGVSIKSVIGLDEEYVRWALENVKFFKLPEGVELPKKVAVCDKVTYYEETDGDYFANMALNAAAEDFDQCMLDGGFF